MLFDDSYNNSDLRISKQETILPTLPDRESKVESINRKIKDLDCSKIAPDHQEGAIVATRGAVKPC
jgi:hypothetical protein